MKLYVGLAAALASCAVAAQPAADVFILPTRESTMTPSISKSIARLILLQRLAPAGNGPSVNEIPDGVDIDEVVSLMNEFSKTSVPLFGDARQPEEPSQLLIMLEGMSEQNIKDTGSAFKIRPAFTISNPPAASAHEKLIKYDLYNVGVTKQHNCSLEQVTNPFEKQCWTGKSTVAKFNVAKNPDVLADLIHKLPSLASLAKAGEMETAIILLPAISESASSRKWSDKVEHLRRDINEQVISSFGTTADFVEPTPPVSEENVVKPPKGRIPSCFTSVESCVSGTNNCSHQGECVDRFGGAKGKTVKEACFVCHCLSTRHGKSNSLTHWAGPTCAKKDISVPFWLFAGTTLALIGIVSLAISSLYSIGDEKLPGVIGAGVSKSK